MRTRFLTLISVFLLPCLHLGAIDNEASLIALGPLRVKAGVEQDQVVFCVPNLQDSFSLEVINGAANGGSRLDSLIVAINGQIVVEAGDLSAATAAITVAIEDLVQVNTLTVQATGPGESFATLILRSSPYRGPPVFGPLQLTAGASATRAFSVENPDAPHVLRFVNGDPTVADPRERLQTMVPSAQITVNGQAVFTAEDFEKMFEPPLNPALTAEISVQPESVIAIALGGVPGQQGDRDDDLVDPRFATVEILSTASGAPARQVVIVSGDGQTGLVNTALAGPLRVQLLNGAGDPVPDEVVFFAVTQGAGSIIGPGSTMGTRMLGALTDAGGFAEVQWTLGLDAGPETVLAYAPERRDEGVSFQAESLGEGAATLHATSGFNQMGLVGTALISPFKMMVADRFGNPVANQPIEVRVAGGGGTIDGQTELTVFSDVEGMAEVTLTLGPEPGLQNHAVEALIPELLGPPVRFLADAQLPGDPARTSLTVRVLNQDRKPMEGAVVSLVGGVQTAVTDARGYFTLTGLPPGVQAVHVDAGGIVNAAEVYPDLTFETVPIIAGNDNTMPYPIYLTALDVANATPIPPDQPAMVATPRIPGLEMGVAAGNAVFPPGVPEEIHITQVANSRIPMPLPDGTQSRLVVTIQPEGLEFNEPAPISFPNVDGLEPGERTVIYSFDHDVGAYVSVGTATVTDDGQSIVSDPGSGIRKAGWHAVTTLIDCNNSIATYQVSYPDGSPAAGASVTVQGQSVKTGVGGTVSVAVSSCADAETDIEQDVPPEPEDEDDSKTNPDQENDPVLLHSGEYIYNLEYLSIPGRGLDYAFKLRYESRTRYNGPTGYGWMHNFDRRLYQDRDGNMRRVDGQGRVDTYRRIPGQRAFAAPSGFYDELFIDDNDDYCIRHSNGTREFYCPISGFIKEIRDRYGNRLRFRYDSRQRLTGVLDAYNREIVYEYNADDRLVRVTDFIGRSVQLAYDGAGDLVRVTGPAVTGTPNGNDFPNGKSTLFSYSSGFADARLNHNLLTVTNPNEAALTPPGPPYLTNVYDSQDRVVQQLWGGTNTTGVAAGGTIDYQYQSLGATPDPDDFNTAVSKTTITDRNGNIEERFYNRLGNLVRQVEQTNRDIRPDDPDAYVTRFEYNRDGEMVRKILPEGNAIVYVYDDGNAERTSQGNVIEVRKIPDADRGGDQDAIVSRFVYEPVYNHVAREIGARENDPDFQPPIGGPVTAGRYTHEYIFDYQEGNNIEDLARAADLTPQALTALLNARGIQMNLGDVNGDGRTDQIAGNIIERRLPDATLLPDSNQAAIEGGARQRIVSAAWFNDHGQVIKTIDPEGNVALTEYHPENDPDGDGVPTLGFASEAPSGYAKRRVFDAETHPRRRQTAALTEIKTDYRYDPVGNLVEIIDGRGIGSRYVVNQLNQTVETIQAADVSAVPDRNGGVDGAPEDLSGQDFQYRVQNFFDANDNLVEIRVENRDGNTVDQGAAPGFIETAFRYDILDDPISQTEEIGVGSSRLTRFHYDANQNLIATTLPEGNVFTAGYDERDLPALATRGDDNQDPYDAAPGPAATVRYAYDGNRNLTRTTDAEDHNGDGLGEQTFMFYDGYDRAVRVLDPVGNETLYVYDPAGNVVESARRGRNGGPSPGDNSTVDNVLLSRSFFQHDELSRIFQIDRALFTAPGVDYNHPPELVDGGLTGGDARVTMRAEFDRNSRPSFRVEDDEDLVSFEYDGLSRLVRVVDGENNERLQAYDDNSNLVRVTEIDRSPEGRVAEETFVTLSTYDALDRTAQTVDNLGQTRRVAYDSRHNPVLISDAQAGPSSDTAVTSQTVTLNLPGNTSHRFYDGLNRLIRSELDLRLDGLGDNPLDLNQGGGDGKIALIQEWDDNSRLTARVDDNGNRSTFFYDALNRLAIQRFADNTENAYAYDRDDNLVALTDGAGSTRTAVYDAVNRLTRSDIARGPGVMGTTLQVFEYDGLHRNTYCFDDNDPADPDDDAAITRKYDSLSRMLEEVQNGQTVASDWFAEGQRVGLTYPNGRALEFTYDRLDRLKTIADSAASVAAGLATALPGGAIAEYDYLGPSRLLETRLGNGVRKTHLDDAGAAAGYDDLRRMVGMRYLDGAGALVAGFEYGYNRENHRLFERRLHGPAAKGGDQIQYDSAYRMVRFQRDLPRADVGDPTAATEDETREYALDGVGNWTALTIAAQGGATQTQTQTINEMNEYERFGGVARVHDDNGNLRDDGSREFAFDALNRLVQVTRKADGQLIARYAYDCLGRRIQRQVLNSDVLDETLRYYYDGYRVIEEQDLAGVTVRQYVDGLGLDGHLSFSRNLDLSPDNTVEATYFHHADAKGWVAALTDETGTVVERYSYDLYGRVRFEDAASNPLAEQRFSLAGNPYSFQGRRLDPETGLYYHRFRAYDPDTGRFIQRDSAGLWHDAMGRGNAYLFCALNPWSYHDPMGESAAEMASGFFDGAGDGAWNLIADSAQFAWDAIFHPIDTVSGMVDGMKSLMNQLMAGDMLEIVKTLYPDLYTLTVKWDELSDYDRGRLIGKILVEEGAPMLTGAGAAKVVSKVKKAKKLSKTKKLAIGDAQKAGTIREKTEILREAGYTSAEIRELMESGQVCFVAGTLIVTAEGLKPIEEIEIGDRVLSRDDRTGEQTYKTVVRTFVSHPDSLYRLTFRSGDGEERELVATAEHPFWVVNKGDWVPAGELAPGDKLFLANGKLADMVRIEIERGPPGGFTTYNFEVEDFHTYFVAPQSDLDFYIWVHNACVRANAKAGKEWEKKLEDAPPDGYDVADQVTIKVTLPDGSTVRIRPDQIIRGPDGKYRIVEAKASATAPFTKNQGKALPHLDQGGVGEVRGKKGEDIGLNAGDPIVFEQVLVVRPTGVGLIR